MGTSKTNDNIKKRLEEDIPVHYHSDGEPRLTPRLLLELRWLHEDALALIRQLEAENTRRHDLLMKSYSAEQELLKAIGKITDKNNELSGKIGQLEAANAKKDETIQMLQDGNASLMRMIDEECEKTVMLELERDAAVSDLEALCGCMACDHAEKEPDSAPCNECTNYNGMVVESKWQWRGVQKETANE